MGVYEDVCRAAAVVEKKMSPYKPKIGVVLGSGLEAFADELREQSTVFYEDVPGFQVPKTEGHGKRLVAGMCGDTVAVAAQGRIHYYEGYSLSQVVLVVRTLIKAGCEILIITNAAGGINHCLEPGDLVLIRDHINSTGQTPLRGDNDDRLGIRFPDMTNPYCPELRAKAREVAGTLGITLRGGILNWHLGPSYETPAEIGMARRAGADLAGMSTVPEVIAARHMDARVLGISCVTNKAAGLQMMLSHDEVKETAERVRETFVKLLTGVVTALGEEQ